MPECEGRFDTPDGKTPYSIGGREKMLDACASRCYLTSTYAMGVAHQDEQAEKKRSGETRTADHGCFVQAGTRDGGRSSGGAAGPAKLFDGASTTAGVGRERARTARRARAALPVLSGSAARGGSALGAAAPGGNI